MSNNENPLDVALPPVPSTEWGLWKDEPYTGRYISSSEGYDEDQLRAYGLACAKAVADDRDSQLAECFRLSGADPDGNEDWRLAPRAVKEVGTLRADYDEACDEVVRKDARVAELEARVAELEGDLRISRDASLALQQRVGELEALSVTNILLEVVPGEYGMGVEIYAKSVDDVYEEFQKYFEQNDALTDENTRLRRQLEAKGADAERYRWLRDSSVPPHNFYISVPVEFHGVRYRPEEVDAYIDAARSARAPQGATDATAGADQQQEGGE